MTIIRPPFISNYAFRKSEKPLPNLYLVGIIFVGSLNVAVFYRFRMDTSKIYDSENPGKRNFRRGTEVQLERHARIRRRAVLSESAPPRLLSWHSGKTGVVEAGRNLEKRTVSSLFMCVE